MTDTPPENPPAFPCVEEIMQAHDNGYYAKPLTGCGMTLRDYFAARALPLAWQHTGGGSNKEQRDIAATLAYLMADAMLRARQS